jgi:hypothetical protein
LRTGQHRSMQFSKELSRKFLPWINPATTGLRKSLKHSSTPLWSPSTGLMMKQNAAKSQYVNRRDLLIDRNFLPSQLRRGSRIYDYLGKRN